jgi:DNA gyrase subunit B
MRPLIEGGYVYCAQPPLYLLKKGKKSEYVLNDGVLNRKLREWGIDGASLVVRGGPGEANASSTSAGTDGERIVTGQELRDLYNLLERVETQTRMLRRRVIDLRVLVSGYLDEDGRLPIYRALVFRPDEPAPIEYYGYSDEEFERLSAEERARFGEVEVIEAGAVLSTTGNGSAKKHRIMRSDLDECRVLEEIIAKLKAIGLSIEDYFVERVEGVDGTIPPARFVLTRGEQEPIEINNLSELVSSIRRLGSAGMETRRFKGLGEMNAEQLWDTTMDPDNRALLKVVLSDEPEDADQLEVDAREADRIFSILMGDNVEARREFIETNAVNVKNLDI